jgi:CheY-like chemotaxis protein
MKKKILIIEDNADIRENTAELLALEGYQVSTAECGEDALKMLEEAIPDLIICDVVMAGIDGYEVFETIKKNEHTAGIKFVFSTAQSEKSHIDKAMQKGIENYLIKPFNEVDLIKCIENCH